MSVNDYICIPYLPYGRTRDGLDCWGLVRLIRKDLRGDLLPELCGVSKSDLSSLGSATDEMTRLGFVETKNPKPGALAAVFTPRLCTHVGIVVVVENQVAVVDTTSVAGVRWRRKEVFDRAHPIVRYYDNAN